MKRKFPVEFDAKLQNAMRKKLDPSQKFLFEVEIGQYYNGYENPSNVYEFE